VTESLRALLDGILDYAGLFPPAKLTLDSALSRFQEGRLGPDAWMLSRFVIPAGRLAELAPYTAALFPEGALFPFSVLGRGGPDANSCIAGLDRDLGDLELFLDRHGSGVSVDACEIKIPIALLEPPASESLVDFFARVTELIERKSRVPITVYFEGTYGPDWHRSVASVVGALAQHRASVTGSKARPPAFKLRCGGAESSALPPVEQVAFVIAWCRDAKVPFKATAGLHHPVRHLDHELLGKVHGFLNVFCAASLAHARGLDEPTLAELVSDEDPRAFVFEGDTFRWRDQTVSAAEIRDARKELVRSFGSCSFDDPRQDLAALGLF
jgi:hypothetical protein